jgi:integrase
MKLTDAKLRNLAEPGKHFDGAGLFLDVTKAGGRYWRLKYRYGGKEKLLALGVYPAVGLKDARERASEARDALQAGDDPSALRKASRAKAEHEAVNTLEAVSREWMAHQAGRWEPVTLARVQASLVADLFPALGDKPLAAIRPGEVMAVVKGIEARGAAEMAARVLQRVKSVYRWAVVHGRIDVNPMLDLMPSEILKPRKVQHRAALADKDLPAFLAALEAYEGGTHTVQALRLLMLTATRPGEVRGAIWAEFDLNAGLWVIPAERMKMRREHRVPLSRQAVELVQAIEALRPATGDDLVFPSPSYRSKPLSENTLNSAMARMGFKGSATAHGFRALFSTVANEAGWNPDVIERQLAHIERNEVRAAYHRSTYMQDRARLMQWWADYLDGRRGGSVVPFPQRMA